MGRKKEQLEQDEVKETSTRTQITIGIYVKHIIIQRPSLSIGRVGGGYRVFCLRRFSTGKLVAFLLGTQTSPNILVKLVRLKYYI